MEDNVQKREIIKDKLEDSYKQAYLRDIISMDLFNLIRVGAAFRNTKIFPHESIEARDLMSKDIAIISQEDGVFSAANIMSKRNISCVVAVDNKEEVAGILTERDILRKIVREGKDPKIVKVREIMSSPIVSVSPQDNFLTLCDLMNKKKIRKIMTIYSVN